MSELLVPIRVDAIRLNRPRKVTGPFSDFEILPWFDGTRDHASTVPNLATSITARPFADHQYWLNPGVHLHWTLPDGLTRGSSHRSAERPVKVNDLWFPAVPNRWLVLRRSKDLWAENDVSRAWLVESDYVHRGHNRPNRRAIAYPRNAPKPGLPPYLYLGRQTELDPRTFEVRDENFAPAESGNLLTTHDPPLTALGYGDPAFAAHYPTCRSVFGLHDDKPLDDETHYDVYGWYAGDVRNPLADMADELAGDPERARALMVNDPRAVGNASRLHDADAPLTQSDWNDAMRIAAAKRFGWAVEPDEEDKFPTSLLCHARTLLMSEDADAAEASALAPPGEIGIGASPAEAYAAFLMRSGSAQRRLSADKQDRLVQSLAATDLASHPLDLGFKLAEARHTEQFRPHPGHRVWVIRPKEQDLGEGTDSRARIPDDLAEDLNRLNVLQEAYDRRREEINGLRQELFADWSHYMQAAYPEGDTDPFAVDLDDLGDLIDRTRLQPLEEMLRETGRLYFAEDAKGNTLVSDSFAISGGSAGQQEGEQHTVMLAPEEPLAGLRIYVNDVISDIQLFGGKNPSPMRNVDGHMVESRLRPGEHVAVISGVLGELDGLRVISELKIETSHARVFGPWGRGPRDARAFRLEPPRGMRITGLTSWRTDYLHGLGILVSAEDDSRYAVDADADTFARLVVEQHTALLTELAEFDAEGGDLTLGMTPGPRFWAPNDPVIALGETRSRASQRHGHDGLLTDDHLDDETRKSSRGLHPTFVFTASKRSDGGRVMSGASAAPLSFEDHWWHRDGHLPHLTVSQGENWHPLQIEWQAEMQPLREGGNAGRDRYDADFVTSTHDLPADQPDLAATAREKTRTYEYLSGRSIINPSAGRLLHNRLQKAPAALRSGLRSSPDAPMILPLGGFHDQLLMRAHELQLPISDPTGLPAQKRLADRVRAAVGDLHPLSPLPESPFHPIRSGEVIVQRLRVIDTFGRTREWRPDKVHSTSRMAPDEDQIDQAALPVRFCQPARLDFRWLSAAHEQIESNAHPASSPVCGWLTPNDLDGSVVVYDAAGQNIGSIDDQARWQPAPGATRPVRLPEEIEDLNLARVIRWLLAGRDEVLVDAFVETLDAALDKIDPMDAASHQARTMLIGRPVAVVRAKIGLALQHHMVQDQSLHALRARMAGATESTHGYEQVRFGVRLGEHGQLNDGLCGYWIDDGDGFANGRFLTPTGLDAAVDHPLIKKLPGGPVSDFPLQLSLAGEPATVTMLVDPRGSVHATTGILPTKSIAIPKDQYHDQVAAMRVTFPTAPILTLPDAVEIPLPAEPGYSWSWLEHDGESWTETPHHPTVTRDALIAGFGAVGPALWDRLVDLGRLQPQEHLDHGLLMQADPNAPDDRFDDLDLDPETVERGLHALAHGIRDTTHHARLAQRVVARDGWLQLRPAPVIARRDPKVP
ncbi:MAG: hypothetical protein AAF557_22585 [Pseudomonadota bacterium]